MKTLRTIYHLARADFLERARGYGFLGMSLFTILITYVFIPAPSSIQIAGLQLGGYRSLYNSAWIGSMTTLLMGEFFLLFAFYFLKGVVERDRQTGVGQIIATTPISKSVYSLGKWLSNIAVMTAMVGLIVISSIVLQFVRGEDYSLHPWALISPFVLVLFPALTVIAAAAVLFDSVNWLRGTVGSILFFFIAYPILLFSLDLAGDSIIYPSIYQACAAQFSGCNPTRQIDAGMEPLIGLPVFHYDGIPWSLAVIAGRLGIILVAAMIVFLAAWRFHRFDPAKDGTARSTVFKLKDGQASVTGDQTANGASSLPVSTLTPLPRENPNAWQVYRRLIQSEIKLTFKGVRWLWYIFAACAIAVSWLLPLDSAILIALPIVWILPLKLWSGMGVRETRFHTGGMVFSAPFPLKRQLPATWFVGVLISLGMGSGVIVRSLVAGQWGSLAALLVGAMFIPSLALAMGIWSGGSKLFEGLYLFAWYLASVVNVQPLDFMGRFSNPRQNDLALFYGGLTLFLIGLAVARRRSQIQQP